MPELIIEIIVLIVTDFYDSILYAKSIAKVFTHLMMMNFNNPVVDVLAIEKLYPFIFGYRLGFSSLFWFTTGEEENCRKENDVFHFI